MVLKTITPEATQTKKDVCQFKWRTLPDDRSCIFTDYKSLQEKKSGNTTCLYAASLTCGIKELYRYLYSLSSDHSRTAFPERSGHQKEGAAPGRRGHSSPVQLDSAVGTSLCCTSTSSLAACSETNHVTEAFPKSVHLLNHPCLIPVFSFSMKPDLD